jgi:hypothetical protein
VRRDVWIAEQSRLEGLLVSRGLLKLAHGSCGGAGETTAATGAVSTASGTGNGLSPAVGLPGAVHTADREKETRMTPEFMQALADFDNAFRRVGELLEAEGPAEDLESAKALRDEAARRVASRALGYFDLELAAWRKGVAA